MKSILLLTWLINALTYSETQWVHLGSTDIDWGYKTPYRLTLLAPKGIHDASDIRNGVQTMQFEIEWLVPVTTEEQVHQHFKELIENNLKDQESIKFNQIIINRLVEKLPEARRADRWHFYFSPDSGTQLVIDDQELHTIIGSEVNRALHHAWLLKDPVTTAKLLNRLLKIGK
ncbi:chalcone isomerase family protein [Marinicella sediminis]|uniref:Chalcone isomerase family protein n=1 Tax=Marinicella sediminis TaxID=1792834 RepID=A0ABV7J9S1_9GAMM|nr:chalcone isomerase family protein [Marinicella sediminis]